MRSRGVFWVLARAKGDELRLRFGERGSAEDPRTIRQGMDAFDFTCLRGEPERFRRDAEHSRGIGQVEPWLFSVWRRPEDGDLMVRPVRRYPLPRPAIAVAGHQAVPVQDAGDQVIIGNEHQSRDGRDDSPKVLLRCPRRRFGKRSSVWTPPIQ